MYYIYIHYTCIMYACVVVAQNIDTDMKGKYENSYIKKKSW